MSDYSPQAEALLSQWNCLSMNMKSVIVRARYLQKKAEEAGMDDWLKHQLQEKQIHAQYWQIGREMRAFSTAEGVEKRFPEDPAAGPAGIGRFVDFRISEEAIPELSQRIGKLNGRVLTLFITLCSIRL